MLHSPESCNTPEPLHFSLQHSFHYCPVLIIFSSYQVGHSAPLIEAMHSLQEIAPCFASCPVILGDRDREQWSSRERQNLCSWKAHSMSTHGSASAASHCVNRHTHADPSTIIQHQRAASRAQLKASDPELPDTASPLSPLPGTTQSTCSSSNPKVRAGASRQLSQQISHPIQVGKHCCQFPGVSQRLLLAQGGGISFPADVEMMGIS